MTADIKKPFKGIKVVDLTSYLAAPLSGRLMAELGADVIKVESFKGDPYRTYGTAMCCPIDEKENPVFDAYNASKRSCPINVKTAKGKELFFKLLEQADVFLTNNREQSLEKLGIDYASIKDRFPRLVYVTVSGYGMKGPDVNQPGFDSIAFFAKSGMLADVVMKGAMPAIPISAGGDNMTGLIGYCAIVTALLARERTGKGDHIDVSLYGNGVWMAGLLALTSHFGEIYPKERYTLKPCNNNVYQCGDGEWVAFTILEFERYFSKFCEVLECPDLAKDPRWQTRADSLKHRAELIPEIEKVLIRFSSDEVVKRLQSVDIVVSKVMHYKDLEFEPQALENDYMRIVEAENGDKYPTFINPLKSENIGQYEFKRGPHLGENTVDVLGELGYSAEEIDQLVKEGIVLKR